MLAAECGYACGVIPPPQHTLSVVPGANVLYFYHSSSPKRKLGLRQRSRSSRHDPEDQQKQFPFLELGLQLSVAVLTLGFLDAGFSGDWSRIGVLSKESEAALRNASYGVVPLAVALIWAINKRKSKSL